jgi:hypothetical protein
MEAQQCLKSVAVGKFGSVYWRNGRIPDVRYSRHDRCERLPAKDLTQAPPVVQRPGGADFLGESTAGPPRR